MGLWILTSPPQRSLAPWSRPVGDGETQGGAGRTGVATPARGGKPKKPALIKATEQQVKTEGKAATGATGISGA